MASMYYVGLFDTASVHLPNKVTRKEDIPVGSVFYEKLSQFMDESDLLCSELVLNSQKYVNGDVLVLKVQDGDNLTVGVVQTILVRSEDVFFVVNKFQAVRNELNFFVTVASENMSSFIKASSLADFKPLIRYGTDRTFKFYLHHHVSYSYE